MKTIAYYSRIVLFTMTIIVTFSLMSCQPKTDFVLLNGEHHSESDYRGEWLVINFWAEWCAPCLEEIPALNQLAAQSRQLGLNVIGVSYDPLSNQALIDITQKWNFKYPVIAAQPVPILSFELPPTLPTNYIIDPDGEVVIKLVGKQTLETLIANLNKAKKDYQNNSFFD